MTPRLSGVQELKEGSTVVLKSANVDQLPSMPDKFCKSYEIIMDSKAGKNDGANARLAIVGPLS